MRSVLLLFILTPIIEMWLLIKVGGYIGAWPTIGLVLLTACIGLGLLRYQGKEALLSARAKLETNQMPVREMADSLFFAVGGALLLTPGFVTDAIGFACLTPGIRTVVIHFFSQYFLQSGHMKMYGFGGSSHTQTRRSDNDQSRRNQVIDGDFERHSD